VQQGGVRDVEADEGGGEDEEEKERRAESRV
jgi:hypothetical protein